MFANPYNSFVSSSNVPVYFYNISSPEAQLWGSLIFKILHSGTFLEGAECGLGGRIL